MKKIRVATNGSFKIGEMIAAALLVAISTAFILNLFSVTTMEDAQPGDVAREDMFATIELNIPDVDTTETRRQEAMNLSPNVYLYDPGARGKTQFVVDRLFLLAEEYDDLRSALKASLKKGNEAEIQAQLEELEARYSDQVRPMVSPPVFHALVEIGNFAVVKNQVIDLLNRIYTREFVEDRDGLQLVDGKAVLFEADKEQEYLTRGFPPVLDRSELRQYVYGQLRTSEVIHDDTVAAVFGLVSQILVPNYVFDGQLTEQARVRAAEAVEVSYLRKKTGEVIVRKGERISPVQARFINSLQEKVRSTISMQRAGTTILLLVIGVFFLYRLSLLYQRRFDPDGVPLFPVLVWTAITGVIVIKGSIFVMGAVERTLASTPLISGGVLFYGVPFSFPAALAALLTGGIPAVIVTLLLAIIVLLLTAGNIPLTLFLIFSSLAAIYLFRKPGRRTTVLLSGFWLGVFQFVFMTVLNFHYIGVDDLTKIIAMAAISLLGGFLITSLVSVLLPIYEGAFRITTDIRLLELANMNSRLLVDLSLKAPGTYQHSILVANLVEAAAKAINANALLARVGTYYHDIGKMMKPEYFVENQRTGDENRHERLTPKMSAIILTNHVKDGVRLAEEHHLPEQVTRFITEHHGTKMMQYFYNKAVSQGAEKGEAVEESEYRYAGPKPTMKETAILMMADAVEAASRTLKAPITAGKLQNLVNRIIKDLVNDNQFSDCNLTFKELSTIADSFLNSLAGMFHARIDYPGFDFNQKAVEEAEDPTRSETDPGIMEDKGEPENESRAD